MKSTIGRLFTASILTTLIVGAPVAAQNPTGEPEPPTTTEPTPTTASTTTTTTLPETSTSTTTLPETSTSTSDPSSSTSTTSTTPTSGSTTTTEPDFGILVARLGVTKGNNLNGAPVQPGDSFEYNIEVLCSSIDEDCQDLVFTDVIPEGLELDVSSLPNSTATREVTWDPATRTVTIAYREPIDNPVGVGMIAGTNQTIDMVVTLPADTDLETGAVISNTATVDAANADPLSATNDVEVDVPRIVTPVTSKTFTDASGVAGSGEATTIQLGVRNGSSTSAEVTSLAVTDATAATFEHLNFTGATVAAFPAGADTAQLLVCTSAGSVCADGDYVAGPATTGTTLALPGGVDPSAVTGVRVLFTNSTGAVLPRDTTGGRVDLAMDLRDTFRSSGAPLRPGSIVNINNCASTVAEEAVLGAVEGTDACSAYRILPDTLVMTPSKDLFPDTDGDYSAENGEYAVLGEDSPVSARISVVNNAPFAIETVTIQEPAPGVANEFAKIDVEEVRLTFPAGATSARLVVNYGDGSMLDESYTPPGPTTVDVDAAGRVTSITVTYTGVDGSGEPSIAPNSTAALHLHGILDGATADDLGAGTSPGIANCARVVGDAGRGDGSGTFAGTPCDPMAVDPPQNTASGVKQVSQTDVPEGQPITFVLRLTNNGNTPLVNPVISDPPAQADGTPNPTNNPFDSLQITGASISGASAGIPAPVIEVYVGTAWVPLAGADLAAATGIRARVPGELNPTQAFNLNITTVRRPAISDDVQLQNCFAATAEGAFTPANPWCSPSIDFGPALASANLNKTIAPGTLPTHVPGLPPQEATIALRTRNTGNLSARTMQITDNDVDFFDAVDFVGFGAIQAPAGANRIQVDAFVGGEWVVGTPTVIASPVLPGTVTPGQVRGLRFTFSSTSTANSGFVLAPCGAASCEGVVNFRVATRPTLVSDPATAPSGTVANTVTGAFTTRLDEPGEATEIPPSEATLTFVGGTPRINVNKGPESSTLAPGDPGTFTLTVTNNGTANVPDLVVVDPIPTGLEFDDTFVGDGGEPYTASATGLPAGTPPLPAPAFEPTTDAATGRVTELRWTFDGWDLPPGATVTITLRVKLAPGVTAGQVVTNTMAAGSDVEGLACTAPDPASSDGTYGEGTFCTDPASVTARAGASFSARKWVSGDPDLGWYSPRAGGAIVPVGGGGCPVLNAGGITYTSTPCVALVEPGDTYNYLMQVINAGTEPATQMRIIDRFPAAGDSGVLGSPRGTEWDNRPVLAGPPTVNAPGGTAVVSYSSEPLCTADLDLNGAGCAGGWSPGFSATAAGMQVAVDFATPLPPGQGVTMAFQMTAPPDVEQVSDPTIAWNSFAHAEATQTGSGGRRVLSPIEPIKVGVALFFGSLEFVKEIGENPAGLAVDDLEYTFTYSCTVGDTVVASGDVNVTPGTPQQVGGIPAGALCEVWESGTNGGVPSATESDPVEVTIEPSTPGAPMASSVTITNDFPMTQLAVAKTVTGDVLEEFTAGPFSITVDCTYLDASLDGFPTTFDLVDAGSESLDVPVGATCTVVETDDGGAGLVSFDPASPLGDSGLIDITAGEPLPTVTVTNAFMSGSIVVVKDTTGAGVPAFSAGPFEFDVVCDFNGNEAVYSTTVTIDGDPDGATVQADPITGLPIGAECTVTETDSAGGDAVPEPVTVVIEENEGNVVSAAFVNPFSAGTISVEKLVDGTAADSEYVSGLTYSVEVECAVETDDGEGGTIRTSVYSDVFELVAGERATAMIDDTTPVLLPLGSRCWATEVVSGGATTVAIDHDSFENGVEVVAAPDELQDLGIVVTNTFDVATLSVSKTAVNGTAGVEYSFTVSCTILDASGETIPAPLLSGEGEFTLAADGTATFDVLEGSSCTVTEVDVPDGATVSIVDSEGDPSDGIVTVSGSASAAFSNTFPAPTTTTTAPTTTTDPDSGIGSQTTTTTDPNAGVGGQLPATE